MRKIYVLDTNVLIHDHRSIYSFEDNEVVVPIFVIEEIDKLKRNTTTAIQARLAARELDEIRKKGCIAKGVELEKGIFFRVDIGNYSDLLPLPLKSDSVDNMVISTTIGIKKKNPEMKVILITKDINMRIKADALGIEVQDYETDRTDYTTLYDGYAEIDVSKEIYEKFDTSGKINIWEIGEGYHFTENMFIKFKYGEKTSFGRYQSGKIRRNLEGKISAWGARARNDEQEYAMELLMDENIRVVSLVGRAGTGKTLLAIAAGLEQVVERKKYKKLLIARPIIPMGKDLGYLPGSEEEKLRPWMQPIYDNIDFLAETKGERTGEAVISGLQAMGLLKIEALTYIRGRSIPNGFIIIDEAQNLTPLEVKTIITRAGENTKIVLTGDPDQIDSPYLDADTNGLTYLSDKLKNESIAGHVTLKKGERSALAELAAKLL
ncbi:PhoH family protein [Cetobacterium sp. 8H]|uniref:PhoH family protein n=1 Tax=Cetobacterium sp. 8H TaxID=2759681 RepID=UPI00163C6481|nr:PhoH family protein [Cetobacterium sp. 8H]MBC2851399.1 PhoH family protein [Cetobacterium sp. 8H]